MVIRIEANRKRGRGFQIHLMDGPLDTLFDEAAADLHSAIACAGELLELLNREQGTSLKLEDVLLIEGGGLEERAREDVNAARMLEDIRSKKFTLSTPAIADMKQIVIDGEEEYLLSGRGVVLTLLFCWRDDKNQKAREGLRRYCEYICGHGRKGGATRALLELDGLEPEEATAWIKRTYARHVQDDAALIGYVMNQ